MRKTHSFTSKIPIVFLLIYVISLSQVYSYTANNTGLSLSSEDNTDTWCKRVKDGPQLYKNRVEIIDNYTYVIGSIGEYFTSDDIYIAKFDSSGTKIWEQTWDGGTYDYLGSYSIDSDNNIFIVGSSTLEPQPFLPSYSRNIFFLRYNTSGYLLWSKTLDTQESDTYIYSIQTDLNNSIYILSIIDNYPNNDTLIITKLNSSGDFSWTQELELAGSLDEMISQIDSIGNIYILCEFYNFNSTLLKINNSGSLQGGYDLGEDEYNFQMKIDYEDNVILTSTGYFGYYQYAIYLTKINSSVDLVKKTTIAHDSDDYNYRTWFLDNIFILIESSMFEYNYSLDLMWNVTIGNNTKLSGYGTYFFGITSDHEIYLLDHQFQEITILEFNRSGTILSRYNWDVSYLSYLYHSFDAKIDSYDNIYIVCSINYINIWGEATILTFLVKNPKNDVITSYLDQIIEDGEIFLYSFLGISCLLSLILVFLTLKPKIRIFNKKKYTAKE